MQAIVRFMDIKGVTQVITQPFQLAFLQGKEL